MDSSAAGTMKVRLLRTQGQGEFEEVEWTVPPMGDDQIQVRALLTGVCRSDIDMMQGNFGPLPDHMQGHEGLGEVVAVGKNIKNVRAGDYVATRGEPAYADYYNCSAGTYVWVPKAEPKYILEPVACGINLVYQNLQDLRQISMVAPWPRLAILGTGFLAWVAYNSLRNLKLKFSVDVIGKSNRELWAPHCALKDALSGQYNVIIDLSGNIEYLNQDVFCPQALLILGSEKSPPVTTSFSRLLWNACRISFPSPRNDKFIHCMEMARDQIQSKSLDVDMFWTRSYNRQTQWREAFADGAARPQNYSRGYIRW
jgi:hypothetical protein